MWYLPELKTKTLSKVPSPGTEELSDNQNLEIDVQSRLDKAGSEREIDTESKIRKIVAQSIQHYFQEFPSDNPYATYFFRDPDILFTDKSMESDTDFDARSSINHLRQNSFQDQSDRSTEKTDNCSDYGDFKAITDYISDTDSHLCMSTGSILLHDVKVKGFYIERFEV